MLAIAIPLVIVVTIPILLIAIFIGYMYIGDTIQDKKFEKAATELREEFSTLNLQGFKVQHTSVQADSDMLTGTGAGGSIILDSSGYSVSQAYQKLMTETFHQSFDASKPLESFSTGGGHTYSKIIQSKVTYNGNKYVIKFKLDKPFKIPVDLNDLYNQQTSQIEIYASKDIEK